MHVALLYDCGIRSLYVTPFGTSVGTTWSVVEHGAVFILLMVVVWAPLPPHPAPVWVLPCQNVYRRGSHKFIAPSCR